MFRLPEGLTWGKLALVGLAVVGGLWASEKLTERRRLLKNLEAHARAHPEDADVAKVLISCNKRLVVSVDVCSQELIKKFGYDALAKVGKMQMQGAFGVPLGPDGKPMR